MDKAKIVFTAEKKGIAVKIYGARFSYCYLDEADDKGTYRAQFVVSKTAEGIEDFRKAYLEMGKTTFSGGAWKSPAFKDGDKLIADALELGRDTSDMELYRGCYIFSANAGEKYKPDTANSKPYSGCYGAAIINIVKYDVTDEKNGRSFGLKAYLNVAIRTADGERFGGKRYSANDLGVEAMHDDPLEGKGDASPAKHEETDPDDIPF